MFGDGYLLAKDSPGDVREMCVLSRIFKLEIVKKVKGTYQGQRSIALGLAEAKVQFSFATVS